MALDPTEITALLAQLEAMAAAGSDLNKFRTVLTDLSNIDLSQLHTATVGITKAVEAQTASNDASLASLVAKKKRIDEMAAAYAGSEKQLQKEIEAQKIALELAKEQHRINEGGIDAIKAQEAALESLEKKHKQFSDTQAETSKISEELFSSLSSLAKGDLAGGLKGLGKSLASSMSGKAVKGMKSGLDGLVKTISGGGAAGLGAAAALGGLAAGLALLGTALLIGKKVVELAMNIADAQSEFMKATGASREFAGSISGLTQDVRAFGASSKEVGAAMQSLFATTTDFTMMSRQARDEMVRNSAALAALGVSNEDFARGSQIAIKAMGQTGIQAATTQREIAALAMDIGVAPQQMAADFATAGPQLAKFGSDGVRAFKDLAIAAKVTGIEVGRLLSITEKFDTFEGAATAAGKLNAALGGNFVNAMELVTATDPVERMKMIRNSILDAGLAFDEMSYYQRKLYAESAGLQDEAELAALMSGNMESLSGNIGKTSEQYADMAKKAATVQSIQEKLNTVMMQLIPVVEPLIDTLTEITDWMMKNPDTIRAGFKVIIGIVGALAVALGVVALVTAPVAIGIGAIAAAVAGLASLLFIDSYASSFLEGLGKIGNGFGFIGEMAAAAASPIETLMDKMNGLGGEMFKGNSSIKVGAEMTTKSLEGIGDASASSASKMSAAAPVIATTSAVSNAVSNATTTNNHNGGGGDSKINIKFDNKKFADLFDVQVEKSIGRAARKAVI